MLVAFPEVQRKAKEEVDSVIGSERPPKLEDWANLPYLQVSFVWRCVGALTLLFHSSRRQLTRK
jgi:hypothetical protein